MPETGLQQEPGPEKDNEAPEGKVERYKEMLGNSRAIFILAADARGIGENKNEKYKPDSYGDTDEHGFMGGGHSRVIAAAEIGQYFPDVKLITTSRVEGKNISLAAIYARELKNLGIPEQQIELEEKSNSTLTEMIEMVKMAKRHGWESVSISTNDYHAERVRVMLDHLEELASGVAADDKDFWESWDHFEKGAKLEIRILSAEEVLPLRDSRYERIIEKVKNSDLYKKRVRAEKRGTEQIKEGTYGKN